MYGPMAQSACSHCQPWHSEAAFPQLGQEQRTKGAFQGGVPLVQPCSSLLLAGCCVSPLLVTGHTLHEKPSPGLQRQKRLLWAGLARTPPGSAAVRQGMGLRAWLWLHTQRLLSLRSSCGWMPVLPGMLGTPEGVDMRAGRPSMELEVRVWRWPIIVVSPCPCGELIAAVTG